MIRRSSGLLSDGMMLPLRGWLRLWNFSEQRLDLILLLPVFPKFKQGNDSTSNFLHFVHINVQFREPRFHGIFLSQNHGCYL